jgi:hypothetical protein
MLSGVHDEGPPLRDSRLVIPSDIRPSIVHAGKAIARVHEWPDVPPIEFLSEASMAEHGKFIWNPSTGQAQEIRIRPAGDHAELTATLELGHWLDYQALGKPGDFASRSDPILAQWRRAVEGSETVTRLENFKAAGTVPYRDSFGRTQHMRISAYVTYLLEPEELFSRSYAQWIAKESNDSRILSQITAATESSHPAGIIPRYWGPSDFGPISGALESVTIKAGWKGK